MAHSHQNKTPRARNAETGEYAPMWRAEQRPDKYVVEWDDRSGHKKSRNK